MRSEIVYFLEFSTIDELLVNIFMCKWKKDRHIDRHTLQWSRAHNKTWPWLTNAAILVSTNWWYFDLTMSQPGKISFLLLFCKVETQEWWADVMMVNMHSSINRNLNKWPAFYVYLDIVENLSSEEISLLEVKENTKPCKKYNIKERTLLLKSVPCFVSQDLKMNQNISKLKLET